MTDQRLTNEPTDDGSAATELSRPGPGATELSRPGPGATELSRRGPGATDLLAVVTSVPGVQAIEPGFGTALRTLDARVRRTGASTARFGLHIDTAEGTALVEVSLDRSRPVREMVRDIQVALRRALAARADHAATGTGTGTGTEVSVRVQSLQR